MDDANRERVRPRELQIAARVSDALVYAAGLAGVIAGGLLFRDGDIGFAIVAWVLTFIAGAALRLASWAARALAELLERSERMENDLAELRVVSRPSPPAAPPAGEGEDGAPPRRSPPDPWRRWGGHH